MQFACQFCQKNNNGN